MATLGVTSRKPPSDSKSSVAASLALLKFQCNPVAASRIYQPQYTLAMGFSSLARGDRFPATGLQRLTTALCLVLMVFASSAAVIHTHPDTAETGPNATHCLICVAAHAPTILVLTVAAAPAVAGVRATVSLPDSDPHSRFLSPDLFIRPPPATV